MWVIDIRHWLDETLTGPAAPQLKFKVKKLCEIITYATAAEAGIPVGVQVPLQLPKFPLMRVTIFQRLLMGIPSDISSRDRLEFLRRDQDQPF